MTSVNSNKRARSDNDIDPETQFEGKYDSPTQIEPIVPIVTAYDDLMNFAQQKLLERDFQRDNKQQIVEIGFITTLNEILSGKVKVWQKQRLPMDDKIEKIANTMRQSLNDYGYLNSYGVITLFIYRGGDMFHIIDGQHRLYALDILKKEGLVPKFKVSIEIFETELQAEQAFNRFNLAVMADEMFTGSEAEREILHKGLNKINKMFPAIFRNEEHRKGIRRPAIRLNDLSSIIMQKRSLEKYKLDTTDKFVEWILKKNKYFMSLGFNDYPNVDKSKVTPSMVKNGKNHGFVLGVFQHGEWIDC